MFDCSGRFIFSGRKMLAVVMLISLLFVSLHGECHAKEKLPVSLDVEVSKVENNNDITTSITVKSSVPIHSGKLTLQLPAIGTSPPEEITLSDELILGHLDKTIEYTIRNTPAGRYTLVTGFEFAVENAPGKTSRIQKRLYLDVESGQVSYSNISFSDIYRKKALDEYNKQKPLNETEQQNQKNELKEKLEELNKIKIPAEPEQKQDIVNQSAPQKRTGGHKEGRPGAVEKAQKGAKGAAQGTKDGVGGIVIPKETVTRKNSDGTKEAIAGAVAQKQELAKKNKGNFPGEGTKDAIAGAVVQKQDMSKNNQRKAPAQGNKDGASGTVIQEKQVLKKGLQKAPAAGSKDATGTVIQEKQVLKKDLRKAPAAGSKEGVSGTFIEQKQGVRKDLQKAPAEGIKEGVKDSSSLQQEKGMKSKKNPVQEKADEVR